MESLVQSSFGVGTVNVNRIGDRRLWMVDSPCIYLLLWTKWTVSGRYFTKNYYSSEIKADT